MTSTKSTLIALLAAFPRTIIARNVIGASCIDGPCADGSCCNGGFCGWTDDKCGGGCSSGPCVEVKWQDIDCAVAEDTESAGNVIWGDSQTNFVFEEALSSWLGASGTGLQRFYGEDGTGTSLTFSEYIAKYVGGPANMKCATLVDRNGCDGFLERCESADGPGGYLLLNSFVALNNIIWNWYDQLSRSATAVSLDMSTFSDTFAPIPNEGLGLTLILDMVTLGYAAVAAPMWKSVFKKQDWFNNPDNFATVEGLTKDLISTGATIAKDATRAGTKLTSQNTLDVRVGAMIETWHAAADTLNQHIFSGDPLGLNDNLDLLKNLITDGKFAGSDLDLLSAEELDGQIKKAIYGQLIPYAWSVGSSEVYPFMLATGKPCSETGADHVPKGATHWCITNEGQEEGFYLMGTFGSSTCVFEDPFTGYKCYDYKAPPGVDELDGTKWGGVTQEDIVVAAYNTWFANGRTNAKRPEESDITNDDMILSESNIRAAGLVWFPVCSTEEAHNNWGRFARGYGKSDNYPCN
ncbi:hypothetical protein AK830_g824 [Neonectria ditissima]|uniref:Chitin-binding type-1 domain-containing protein n=1 Tax=Neonectria ditissima TaxID=78410 RepID=A0A0P7BP70_9HYPO|nr:hypothetical protein AK830_g824 [Neonectria ditissima]